MWDTVRERQVLAGLTTNQLLAVHQACWEPSGLCRSLCSPRGVCSVQLGWWWLKVPAMNFAFDADGDCSVIRESDQDSVLCTVQNVFLEKFFIQNSIFLIRSYC